MANVHVGVDQKVRLDLKLEVGAMTESVEIQAETPLAPDLDLRARHDRRRGADQDAAAERPQLRQPDAHDPRRPARHPGRQHRRGRQPGLARLGVVLRQRPAPARQQLPARRRRQQRDLAADRGDLPERRRPRRVQDADEHLLGRVRQVARRRRQPADQVGHATSSTAARSSSCATTPSTPTTSSTTGPAGPSPTSSSTSSAARSAVRSSRTRRSSSSTTRASAINQGQTYLSTVPIGEDAAGRLLGAQPGHLRPARPGQPFPGNIIPRRAASTPPP